MPIVRATVGHSCLFGPKTYTCLSRPCHISSNGKNMFIMTNTNTDTYNSTILDPNRCK